MLGRPGICRIDRFGDPRRFFDGRRYAVQRDQCRQPLSEEASIGGAIGQRQRVEPGRLAGPQRVVDAADCPQKDFSTAILVEKYDARRESARLGKQEAEHYCFARPGRADYSKVSKVAAVEIEEIGASRGGFEQGHRVAPEVVRLLADRKVMCAGKTGKIGRRN